jgi:acetoin utilization deacetylase AcuC-like enzyme
MSVGVIYDPVFLKHDTGDHPENARRLEAIVELLKTTGTWDELTHVDPRAASINELELAHSGQLISKVKEIAESGGGSIDSDTVISRDSFEVSLYAAGAAIQAVENVVSGKVGQAFALVRPPGHHATRDRAMGFCLFNNIAVATLHALVKMGLSRILILDWDVHHGNGTQSIFEHDRRVCYVSLHEWPHYPGTGKASETGTGNLVNIPLPAGCGNTEYLRIIEGIVLPIARRFKPEIILISAGFDGHWSDPLASMKLSVGGYAGIARLVFGLAKELCQGRLILTLEGGYSLDALAASAKAVFDTMLGINEIFDPMGLPSEYRPPQIDSLMSTLKIVHHL